MLFALYYVGAVTGFEISVRGCCGTGMIRASLCDKNAPFVCSDASKYVFWDAIHPTQKVYEIVAELAIDLDLQRLF